MSQTSMSSSKQRILVAEQIVSVLEPPHHFAHVLHVLDQAHALHIGGILVEELDLIVVHQSRGRLLQRAVRICIEYDDMATLTEAIHVARVVFLKSVQGYVPCHCRECVQWAVELDKIDAYVSVGERARLGEKRGSEGFRERESDR